MVQLAWILHHHVLVHLRLLYLWRRLYLDYWVHWHLDLILLLLTSVLLSVLQALIAHYLLLLHDLLLVVVLHLELLLLYLYGLTWRLL